MPPVPASVRFEIVSAALALAEERRSIQIAEAADIVGATVEDLRTYLEPVLFLEYRDSTRQLINRTGAFLLNEDDILSVDGGHWLRDWDSSEPNRESAMRLFLAATTYQAITDRPSMALNSAITKLRKLVAVEVIIPFVVPPCLYAVNAAWSAKRSLEFRYTKFKEEVGTDRVVLCCDVFYQWGAWYAFGPELSNDTPKYWRIDRMQDATVGPIDANPPADLARASEFDLSQMRREITVRVPPRIIYALPQPHKIIEREDESDGRVRARVAVDGDRQLDHLLVALGPDGDVVSPVEYIQQRQKCAEALLAAITQP